MALPVADGAELFGRHRVGTVVEFIDCGSDIGWRNAAGSIGSEKSHDPIMIHVRLSD